VEGEEVEKAIRRVRLPWPVLKAEFVRRRLDGESLTLAAFAQEKNIDRRSVERHASREHWIAAIEARAQERLDAAHDRRIVNSLYRHLMRSTFRVR
jgi:hypothetical protein